METQVTKVEPKELTKYNTTSRDIWDSGDTYSTNDVKLARITLVGNGSQLANDGKGQPGDLLNSDGYSLLAKKGETIEILPVSVTTDWVKYQKIGTAAEAEKVGTVPLPPTNVLSQSWTTETALEDGVPTFYKKRISCYVVSPANGMELPFTISFKGLSAFSGSSISSHFQLSKAQGVPPIGYMFTLCSKLVEWNGKKHFAFEALKGRPTTDLEKAQAVKWRQIIFNKAANVVVAEDSEEAPF